ncbi:MAG: primosomal protein N' [Gammaproteobacteria bacterium]|nr:primosomal protein N' [Gammaproteobacteria bacterium]
MSTSLEILRVAIPTPLRRHFDYLVPLQHAEWCQPGCRVRVPFGRQQRLGVILERVTHSDVPPHKLKRVEKVLDDSAVIPSDLLDLLRFASDYYQHAIGEVIAAALPAALRAGKSTQHNSVHWRITAAGHAAQIPVRAAKQTAVLARLRQAPHALSEADLKSGLPGLSPVLQRLHTAGWIEPITIALDPMTPWAATPAPALSAEQTSVIEHLREQQGFGVSLLDGITGSGKTEVYLQWIAEHLARHRQVLMLVPEIGLTPQLLSRFSTRLHAPIALWHSGLSDSERLQTWRAARTGSAAVFIGTRSAVFLPLRDPALVIIDEEHDPSFKQQEGFRYSARDLAVLRARRWNVPILLGSATPSLETLANVARQRYTAVHLTQRAGGAQPPRFQILDMRRQPLDHGLSMPLIQRMREHLNDQAQVLLFLNRRGFAPALLCHDCGWIATCPRCDAHLTLHRHEQQLRCHHCGLQRRENQQCPTCQSSALVGIGIGTERIESGLRTAFADVEIVRIDRDTTRRKGSLGKLLERVREGRRQILVGTQMLSKGHHFPNVTLVGILDTDQGLHSADFRATERMAQQIMQVSGRAGRADRPGEVLIQTHHPDHPLLHTLITQGYNAFAQATLQEREQTELPPFSHMAILRAESTRASAALDFLRQVADRLATLAPATLHHYGPFPAPMEKRAGRVRAQLVLISKTRGSLQTTLRQLLTVIETDLASRSVRWSIDVDPIDMY